MKQNGYNIISLLIEDVQINPYEVAADVSDRFIDTLEKKPPRKFGQWTTLHGAKLFRKYIDKKIDHDIEDENKLKGV